MAPPTYYVCDLNPEHAVQADESSRRAYTEVIGNKLHPPLSTKSNDEIEDEAKNFMLIAIAIYDSRLASEKHEELQGKTFIITESEDGRGKPNKFHPRTLPILHAFTEQDADMNVALLDVVEIFRNNLEDPKFNHHIDTGMRDKWKEAEYQTLAALVHLTLLSAGPCLAWRRHSK